MAWQLLSINGRIHSHDHLPPTTIDTASDEMVLSGAGAAGRIVVVGVGGATCSGKTTLAKHLLHILNPSSGTGSRGTASSGSDRARGIVDAFILHQDDFAPPEATLPVNEQFGVTDWDHPPTAVSWRLA